MTTSLRTVAPEPGPEPEEDQAEQCDVCAAALRRGSAAVRVELTLSPVTIGCLNVLAEDFYGMTICEPCKGLLERWMRNETNWLRRPPRVPPVEIDPRLLREIEEPFAEVDAEVEAEVEVDAAAGPLPTSDAVEPLPMPLPTAERMLRQCGRVAEAEQCLDAMRSGKKLRALFIGQDLHLLPIAEHSR